MNKKIKEQLEIVTRAVRCLSIDSIQKANSGHPGICLGIAPLLSLLYGEVLKHNPSSPSWINRDRFILSAGHGSASLYSILHLAGYDISIEDLKHFRQLYSKCPGHPEYLVTPGVECTTGPLGQGIAISVGVALAESILSNKFNTPNYKIIDHYTYSLVGEGCLMEGVSAEASSLAGHLGLGKLIVFYDENRISIDGSTDITFTEDLEARYKAYGWQVLKGDMEDTEGILSLIKTAKEDLKHPSFIMLKSTIGKCSPLENSAASHGAPLGVANVKATKEVLGLPNQDFYVPQEAYDYFNSKKNVYKGYEEEWQSNFQKWATSNPALKKEFDEYFNSATKEPNPSNLSQGLSAYFSIDGEDIVLKDGKRFTPNDDMATRASGGIMLNYIASLHKNLVGGSADLAGPNKTTLTNCSVYQKDNTKGRMIEYGVREFAMSAISGGIALHGGLKAFCATFLVFIDYLRASLRLNALMGLPVIYILTHDSIYVGEDGPTHEPVETLSCLRNIPRVKVYRPADSQEVALAFVLAIEEKKAPICIALSRQNIKSFHKDDPAWCKNAMKGAYIVRQGGKDPAITILATGSEVSLSLEAVSKKGRKDVRVISVFDLEKFSKMDSVERQKMLGEGARVLCVEAGIKAPWYQFVKDAGDIVSIDDFGLSAPAGDVAKALHFTAEDLADKLQ